MDSFSKGSRSRGTTRTCDIREAKPFTRTYTILPDAINYVGQQLWAQFSSPSPRTFFYSGTRARRVGEERGKQRFTRSALRGALHART